jgi:hypothetical protein
LRLGENRRLNKEAHFSQRRKGGAIYFSKTINAGLNSRRGYAARADQSIFVELAPEDQ